MIKLRWRWGCGAGASALAILSDPAQAADIDIVFLDIRMPGMTGIELMQALATVPARPACPVVAVTGSVEPDTVEELR